MLTLGLTGRIWVCVQPQDGRKSFDGLAAVVTAPPGPGPVQRRPVRLPQPQGRSAEDPGLAGRRIRPLPAPAGEGHVRLPDGRRRRGERHRDRAGDDPRRHRTRGRRSGGRATNARRPDDASGFRPRARNPRARVARTGGMTPAPAPDADLAALRAEAAHLRRVNQELLATVAELRATVEKQQAHIDRLVRMTFGRSPSGPTGPTLFDGLPDPEPRPRRPRRRRCPEPPPSPPRRGGGATAAGPRPADLPRERVEIDLTEAEKACPCCQRPAGPDRRRRVRAARLPPGVPVRPADRPARPTPAGTVNAPGTTRRSLRPPLAARADPPRDRRGRAARPRPRLEVYATTCRSTARSRSSAGSAGT